MAGLEAGDPRVLGSYRVVRQLGSGGRRRVYLGEGRDGRRVAIKLLQPRDSDAEERLDRSVRHLREVRSPNIARIVDADLTSPQPWVATEYVPGPSLDRVVKGHGPLPVASIRVIAARLATALEAVHSAHEAHRDLKPANVLITRSGPRLIDFGFEGDTGYGDLYVGLITRDPQYMSPEQLEGHTPGPRSDIFSLGSVLAFAATGQPPFGAGAIPSVSYRILSGYLQTTRLPYEIEDIVWACLAREPARRPTATELRARIGRAESAADWLPALLAHELSAREDWDAEPTPSPDPGAISGHLPGPGPQIGMPQDPGDSPAEWHREFETGDSGNGGNGTGWKGAGDTPPLFQVPPPHRYLRGQYPDHVRAGEPFSLLASIVVRDLGAGSAALKPFDVGPNGADVLLVLNAPRLSVLGPPRQVVHVPPAGDSEPVMFELLAYSPGPQQANITAWLGGTYLGQLTVEVTADVKPGRYPHREVLSEIDAVRVEGAVSLVVRYDPAQNAYRFEFRDEDNPEEVTSHLAYDPRPQIEHLVADLDRLARGRVGYSAAETRDYLVNAGAGLWQDLIPGQLRQQFWDRQHRITQLTILADRDAVPWELLYPLDPGRDAGFLVEQFPVTRVVFGRSPVRSLSLEPAWFVLPDGSPPQARDEVDALRGLLDAARPRAASVADPVIGALTPLLNLIHGGNVGLLHFACHNTFDPVAGSAITLDRRQFTPVQLNTAAVRRELAVAAPTVFINACRSAGTSPTYHELDGWAQKFLQAGAAAFIGSLWTVRDDTARTFASELYRQLQSGAVLGHAVMNARRAAASEPGDPTWLAYAVYGDPRATLR